MKISWMLIISIGIMLSAIALGFGYRQWEPNMKEIESWKIYRDGLRTEAGKSQQAIKRVQDAEKLAQQKIAEWQTISAARSLPANLNQGGFDIGVHGWQLVLDAPLFRNSMQKMLNTQLKVGGVKVIQGPAIPAPPTDPGAILATYLNYPVLPPVVIFDLGTVTVEGTYKQITDNMKAWSTMPHFLAVADGLRLQGTAPKLTGTYAVSIVGFLQTTRPPFPPLPEGGRTLAAQTGTGGGAAVASAVGAINAPGTPGGPGAAAPGRGRGAAGAQGGANRPGAGATPPATGGQAGRPNAQPGRGGAALPPAGAANRPGQARPGVNRPGAANNPGAVNRPGAARPNAAGAARPGATRPGAAGAAGPNGRRPGAATTGGAGQAQNRPGGR